MADVAAAGTNAAPAAAPAASTPAGGAPAAAPAAPQGAPAPAQAAPEAGARPSVADLTTAAIEMARSLPADGAPAPAKSEAGKGEAGKTGDKPAGDKQDRAPTVTVRLSQLSGENRALKERIKALEKGQTPQQTTPIADPVSKTDVAKRLREDPGSVLKEFGVSFEDIVMTFAEERGREPTEKEKQELRLAALEAAQEDQKKEREARETESRKQAAQAERAGAMTAIGNIVKADAEKFKNIAAVLADGAPPLPFFIRDPREAAMELATEALRGEGKLNDKGEPVASTPEEALEYVRGALEVIEEEYARLGPRFAPAPAPAPKPEVKADDIVQVARSKQSGPRTITASMQGQTPLNGAPQRMTPDEARRQAIEAARRLPQ